ncbi:MAG: hypothetical protein RLZZ627_437 [Pseudomonadota bacterium]|jgi:hypothetical protein
MNWNIGFEWLVTGAAVIGVIVLLVTGGDAGNSLASQTELQAPSSSR